MTYQAIVEPVRLQLAAQQRPILDQTAILLNVIEQLSAERHNTETTDVTTCKRIEAEREQLLKQLAAERARLEVVVQQLPVGVIIANDPAGSTLTINCHAEQLLRLAWSPAEQRSQQLVDRPDQDDSSFVNSGAGLLLKQALLGIATPASELNLPQTNGDSVPVMASATPVLDSDEHIIGAVVLLQDFRPLKEIEILRRIDQLKSEFIAAISHEFRTLLHHIKGYATTLLRPQVHFDAETMRDYLRIVVDESEKLERLLVDLLDTSAIETGNLTLEIESVHIDELVHRVLQPWQETATHHFETRIPCEVPPVPADARRITQVLDNLLANVVKYTPAHTRAVIDVQVTRDEVIVSVSDTGPGVQAEHLPHLFERFYRATPHNQYRRQGNGLGLFICKGIIERHRGRIWIDLMPDSGFTICFALPRRRKASRTS